MHISQTWNPWKFTIVDGRKWQMGASSYLTNVWRDIPSSYILMISQGNSHFLVSRLLWIIALSWCLGIFLMEFLSMEVVKCVFCFGLIGHMVLLGDIKSCFLLLQFNHDLLVQFKERLFWDGKGILERNVFWEYGEGRGSKE